MSDGAQPARRLNLAHQPDRVDPSAFLAAGVVVLGDVTIGAEASLWFHAVARGDTEAIRIGARTNIQDGAILHADPGFPCEIGSGVTVGHGAIVHGAAVEDDALIGMRAVVLNGARIGAGSVVGAGAVVPSGLVVPPRSLVLGVPAKVERELGVAVLEKNRKTADHYVEAAKAYRAAGLHRTPINVVKDPEI